MKPITSIRSALVAAAVVTILPLITMAQGPCTDYHKFNCNRASDKRFSVNGQSKSAAVQVGQETELNIIVYRGQDYRISLCYDDKVLGEGLAIRLVEKVRQAKPGTGDASDKVEYEELEKVLWDNTEHEMAHTVEFSCTSTKRIAVEVVAPGGAASGKKSDKAFDIGCVGILIEHMPTPGLGF